MSIKFHKQRVYRAKNGRASARMTAPTPPEIQHSVIWSVLEKGDQRILVVAIKLFSNTLAPGYVVVLGRKARLIATP